MKTLPDLEIKKFIKPLKQFAYAGKWYFSDRESVEFHKSTGVSLQKDKAEI